MNSKDEFGLPLIPDERVPPMPSIKNTKSAKRKSVPLCVEKPSREDFVTEMLAVVAARCPEIQGHLPEIESWARERFGGMRWYAASHSDRQELVRKIREEFNGRNVGELAKRYGVARTTVYRYLTGG